MELSWNNDGMDLATPKFQVQEMDLISSTAPRGWQKRLPNIVFLFLLLHPDGFLP